MRRAAWSAPALAVMACSCGLFTTADPGPGPGSGGATGGSTSTGGGATSSGGGGTGGAPTALCQGAPPSKSCYDLGADGPAHHFAFSPDPKSTANFFVGLRNNTAGLSMLWEFSGHVETLERVAMHTAGDTLDGDGPVALDPSPPNTRAFYGFAVSHPNNVGVAIIDGMAPVPVGVIASNNWAGLVARSMAVDPITSINSTGTLWVLDSSGRLWKEQSPGQLQMMNVTSPPGAVVGQHLVIAPNGELYITITTTTPGAALFHLDGSLRAHPLPGDSAAEDLRGLAADATHLWFLDVGAQSVSRIAYSDFGMANKEETILTHFAIGAQTDDIAVDDDCLYTAGELHGQDALWACDKSTATCVKVVDTVAGSDKVIHGLAAHDGGVFYSVTDGTKEQICVVRPKVP